MQSHQNRSFRYSSQIGEPGKGYFRPATVYDESGNAVARLDHRLGKTMCDILARLFAAAPDMLMSAVNTRELTRKLGLDDGQLDNAIWKARESPASPPLVMQAAIRLSDRRILCSQRGRGHRAIIESFTATGGKLISGKFTLGFKLSDGRFQDRKAALATAIAAGQVTRDMCAMPDVGLLCEDLWQFS